MLEITFESLEGVVVDGVGVEVGALSVDCKWAART